VYIIDGLNGVEACYYYAGVIGINAAGITLRRLWMMACGRIRQQRIAMTEQAYLVWAMGDIDIESYTFFGQLTLTGVGGQMQVSPDMQAKIDAEVEKTRRENPELPQWDGGI